MVERGQFKWIGFPGLVLCVPMCRYKCLSFSRGSGKSNGGFSEGGFLVAIASEVSTSSKDSLAITDFLAKETQQLTYGVVSEGVFAESLRKFCGKFAETTSYCARKGCGNSVEISRKFAESFLQ